LKTDALVKAGKITPAVVDKLKASFIGADNGLIRASLSVAGEADTPLDLMLAALEENTRAVHMGELTGPQTTAELVKLSNAAGNGASRLNAMAERMAKGMI
jgi:hypothetical protein